MFRCFQFPGGLSCGTFSQGGLAGGGLRDTAQARFQVSLWGPGVHYEGLKVKLPGRLICWHSWSTANVAYLGGYETSRRWGLPEGLGHSPLSNLSMGPVTSHSCCSREKPVPRHACIAMTDCFPQNITQINPFSTLSGFCRNPVSNEEGK